MIEENYPHFEKVKENEKNFNKYLENKMNDDEFTRSIFNKIFVKKGLLLKTSSSFSIAAFKSLKEKNFLFLSLPTIAIVQSPTDPSTAALSLGFRTLAGIIDNMK